MGEWTFSFDISAFAFCFGGASYTYSIVVDDESNIGIQKNKANPLQKTSGTVIGGLNAGISGGFTWSNCDTIYDLEGESSSANVGVANYGVSAFTSNVDDIKNSNYGFSFSTGLSVALVDLHFTGSKTETLCSFNLGEWLDNTWREIKSWF